jgi:hypothetical protein
MKIYSKSIRVLLKRFRKHITCLLAILLLTAFAFVTTGVCTESAGQDITIYPWQPITNRRVLPHSLPEPATPSRSLFLQACPGEYEPASFVIQAGERGLEDVTIVCSDLKQEAGKDGQQTQSIIPKQNIDIRVVKCWYQLEGEGLWVRKFRKKVLIPELLLHDDNLIQLHDADQTNAIRPVGFKDSDWLLPFPVPAHEYKQIWITCYIPPDVAPGLYKGKILALSSKSSVSALLDLTVKVLPFTLDPPILDYAIYYRGKLIPGEKPPQLGSEYKTPQQMKAELRDIMSHGFKYATIYQPIYDRGKYHFDMLDAALRLRQEVGLPIDPILFMSIAIKRDQSLNPDLAELSKELDLLFDCLRKKNIRDIYIYGWDEATGNILQAQRPVYDLIHKKGAKVVVACSQGYFDIAGDLIDLPIYYEWPPRDLIEAVHGKGFKIWVYHLPQGGMEDPVIYRRNYGFKLWQSGVDGVCLYPYQHVFGNLWNEFDNPDYRNEMMTYPTDNGVISTIQWEGMREGIDDVRYLTTLLNELKNHDFNEQGKIVKWLKEIDLAQEQPGNLRRKIIDKIIELRKLNK